jgi:hypothetical protein
MKKILGLAIVGLLFSVPAHGQRSLAGTLGSAASSGVGFSGGGGVGGGSAGGSTFHTLPAVPPTEFLTVDVSGSSADFAPSSWVEFKNGLQVGTAQLTAGQKSLGDVAAQYRRVERRKAKLAIVEDAFGNAVIERR